MAGLSELNYKRSKDGKVYYLVASDGSGRIGVKFVEYYSSLASLKATEKDGVFFVRDASRRRPGGDPTVKYGWGMYVFDFINEKWVKIAEQESLDGGTDIESELLEKFVTQTAFNTFRETTDQSLTQMGQGMQQIVNAINNDIAAAIRALQDFNTSHNELWTNVLEKLSTQNSVLYFDGKPVADTVFIYNNNNGTDLVWVDPTVAEPVPEVVADSKAIADKFAATALARYGASVIVVEIDGSLSSYVFVKNGDNKVAVFDRTSMSTSIGVTYVESLPAASAALVNRGLFIPTVPTGDVPAGHLFDCRMVSGTATWVDVTLEHSTYNATGARITICLTEDDLNTLWKTSKIFWEDPSDAYWGETVLVRKQGSAPTSITDGTVVGTFKTKVGAQGVVDTVPYMESDVFYNVFSKTKSGMDYQPDPNNLTGNNGGPMGKPELLGWTKLKSMIADNLFRKVFQVGDYIILPPHSLLGDIKCRVTAINDSSVEAVSCDVLTKMAFKENADDPVAYGDSDVCSWLNSTFLAGFGDARSRIAAVIIPDDDEYPKYYEREGEPTPYWANPEVTVSAAEAATVKGVAIKVTL